MSNNRDTSDTEYHEYQRPPVGEDWEDAWDELVGDLDANLKLRGVLGDRPATAPDGSEYEVVDPDSDHHGKIYQYDDDSGEWALADRQFKTISTGALTVDFGSHADVADSRDFGEDYQNTTGSLLTVQITIRAEDVVPDCAFGMSASVNIDPDNDITRFTHRGIDGDGLDLIQTIGAVVPDGHYYWVREGAENDASILSWVEIEWSQ